MYDDIPAESLGKDNEGEPEFYDEYSAGNHRDLPTEHSYLDTVNESLRDQEKVMDPSVLIRGYGSVDRQEIGSDNEGDPIIDGIVISSNPDLTLEEQIRNANLVGSEEDNEQDVYDLVEDAKRRQRAGKLTSVEQEDLQRLVDVLNGVNIRRSSAGHEYDPSTLHKDVPSEEIGSDIEGEPIWDDKESVMHHGIHQTTQNKDQLKSHDEL